MLNCDLRSQTLQDLQALLSTPFSYVEGSERGEARDVCFQPFC